jgi:hypothetical protein
VSVRRARAALVAVAIACLASGDVEVPDAIGIRLALGSTFRDDAGVARAIVRGAYRLPGVAPERTIVLIGLLEGSTRVTSSPVVAGSEAAHPGGPVGGSVPADLRKGGTFEVEIREALRIPSSGGLVHVFAQAGAVRSDVLSVSLAPVGER